MIIKVAMYDDVECNVGRKYQSKIIKNMTIYY